MNDYIDKISRYFLADVNLTLDRPYRTDEVQRLLRQVPGVARVEGWGSARSELVLADGSAGETVQLLAPPVGSQLVEPIMLKGRWLIPGDENAIGLNERFMNRYPDLEIGDTIRLRVNGEDSDWVVVGFFQLAGQSSGYLAYANYEYLSRLINLSNQATTFRIVSTQKDLTQEQQEALGQEIESHLRKRSIRIVDITAGQFLSTTAASGFSTLTAFMLFLAGLTALVGSIGLAGTMSMNVLERTREIGVMRAIGASNRILIKMVLTEGILIGMLSWLIGSLLAFPISRLLTDSVSLAIFGMTSALSFTTTGFLLWLVAVVVLSILASLLPARNAARLTIREVLAYE
jgi:putative ABC transport system permease protein